MWPARIRSAPAGDERAQHVVPVRDGRLRAARHGAPSRWWWSTTTRSAPSAASREPLGGARELRLRERAALVAERPRRVEPDDVQARRERDVGSAVSQTRSNSAQGRMKRGRRVRKVVVARHREHRRPERAQAAGGALELRAAAAVREIAGGDDELRAPAARRAAASAASTPAARCVPVWRSETWRSRAFTTERGYRLRLWPTSPPRSSTTSTSACGPAARCASSGAARS